MKKIVLMLFLCAIFFSYPLYADESSDLDLLKSHFTPFGISLSAEDADLTEKTWLDWQVAYLNHRKELGLSFKSKLGKNVPISLDRAIKAYQLKKEDLKLSKAMLNKSRLSEQEGLALLRRIDTYYGYPDILVYGSELESISASLSAKKEGTEVVLAYEKPRLGGLAVNGALNYIDIPQSDGAWLLQGFAQEFHKHLGNGYDLDKARKWLFSALNENRVLFNQVGLPKRVSLENGEIKAISFKTKTYHPKVVVDASENGDLLPFIGANYTKGLHEDEEIYPAASLLYILEGVDYKKASQFLTERAKNEGTFEGAINRTAWGYKKEMSGYQPRQKGNVVRALNIAYIKEKDKVVINHLFNTEINPLNEASKEAVTKSLKDELKTLLPYLKNNLVGFENAKLSGFANELYLRDSRHFLGSYQLSVADIVNRTRFDDRLVITNYPIDIHAGKTRKENLILYYPQSYEIPYRVLHDTWHKNYLITSKCASYHPLAAGSTRIIMTGTMVSEAGGIAASLAVKEKKAVQEISVKDLQDKLRGRGFRTMHEAPLKRVLSQREIKRLEAETTYEELIKETYELRHFFPESSV